MSETTRPEETVQAPVRYGPVVWIGAPMLALGLAIYLYGFTPNNLCCPLRYSGDALAVLTWSQTLIETGWWMSDDRLGFPGRMDMRDYATNPNLHFALMKGLVLLGVRDAVVLVNLYYLLSFPLIALTSLAACRSLRLPGPAAVVASVLFALLHSHFWRGTSHLFLSTYFMVPLQLMTAIWVARGEGPAGWGRWRWLAAALIAFLLGFDFPYYPVFGCFFLTVAGLQGALRGRSWRPIVRAASLVAVTAVGFLINMSPSLLARWQNGPNLSPSFTGYRTWMESEIYGLKPTALLLPHREHRSRLLRQAATKYHTESPLNSSDDCPSLGLIGAAGLLGLLAWAVAGRAWEDSSGLMDTLTRLTLAGLMLSMVGGLGALLNFTISPIMRCYDRMSVYIGLLALLAIAASLARLARVLPATRLGRGTAWAVAAGLIALGAWDQAGKYAELPRPVVAAAFAEDARFFRQVEEQLPPGGAVFMLPNQSFLSSVGPCVAFGEYPHFRGFLHTRRARWSYGAICGRPTALLLEDVAKLPVPELVEQLCLLGFDGICFDRACCPGKADALDAELRGALGPWTAQVQDASRCFYPLAAAKARLAARYSPAELQRLRAEARRPVLSLWSGDFDNEERASQQYWRWCRGDGKLHLFNLGDQPRTVRLSFGVNTISRGPARLRIEAPRAGYQADLPISEAPTQEQIVLTLPPGETVVRFHSDAKPVVIGRRLVFALRQYQIVAGP